MKTAHNRLFVSMTALMLVIGLTVGITAKANAQAKAPAQPASANAPAGPQTTGGPDAAGYTFKDSLETGCPVNFVSIAGTGTNLALTDDSASAAQNLGFTYRFYGADFTQAFAGSNGFVSFGAGSSTLTNQCLLPSATAPSNLIAGIWDDLLPSGTNNIFFQAFTAGTCPGGRTGACAIFEWNAVPYFSGGGSTTFQIILRDTAPVSEDIVEIQLQSATQTGSGSTTGIENSTGTIGLTYFATGTSCNTASSIITPRAVYFMPSGVTSCLGLLPATSTPTATPTLTPSPTPTSTPTLPPVVDNDADGVSNTVEDGAPNAGDGNADGTPDRSQPNVASLPNAASGAYLTVFAPAGMQLSNVRALPNPSPFNSPPGVNFPAAFVEFGLRTMPAPPASVVVQILYAAPGIVTDQYWRYGPEPGNPADHWYRFDPVAGSPGTGATRVSNLRWDLTFVDGARGDDDLIVNGTLLDQGGPGLGGFTGAVGGFGMGEVSRAAEPAAVAPAPSRLPFVLGGMLLMLGAAVAWAARRR